VTSIFLLRCKAEPRRQTDAFAEEDDPSLIVAQSFLARPTARVPRGAVWHIGNTSEMRGGAIFFALGREVVVRAHEFDNRLREFREIEQSQAPFTVGVYDPKTQVAGILVRQGVSMNAREVAGKIATLLEEPGIARRNNREIVVDFIPDPTGFISALENAHRITRFEFEFSPPNPPGDNKYIRQPLKSFAQRTGAEEGKVSVRGQSLDREELAELTRDIAAAGDNATATLQADAKSPLERRSLNVNPFREPVDAGLHEETGEAILRATQQGFISVANKDTNA